LCLESGAVSGKGIVVSRSPTQVGVVYRVAAGGHFVASWCHALMVEMIVGAAAVSAYEDLVAGHA